MVGSIYCEKQLVHAKPYSGTLRALSYHAQSSLNAMLVMSVRSSQVRSRQPTTAYMKVSRSPKYEIQTVERLSKRK